MKKIREMQNRLSAKLNLPTDALCGAFRAEWNGDSVRISACKRICGYSPEKITVQTADGLLSVSGKRLKCLYFYESSLQICGNIQKIEVGDFD